MAVCDHARAVWINSICLSAFLWEHIMTCHTPKEKSVLFWAHWCYQRQVSFNFLSRFWPYSALEWGLVESSTSLKAFWRLPQIRLQHVCLYLFPPPQFSTHLSLNVFTLPVTHLSFHNSAARPTFPISHVFVYVSQQIDTDRIHYRDILGYTLAARQVKIMGLSYRSQIHHGWQGQ